MIEPNQFSWEGTNQRTDGYGGDLAARTRFAAEVIREVRSHVGPEFPVCLRFSQWKLQDYNVKLAQSPAELERFLLLYALPVWICSIARSAATGNQNLKAVH